MSTEQLTGLQLAVKLIAQIGDDDSDRAIAAVHAAADERDELRAKYDELLVALHGIGKALGIPECERSPYSVTCGTLERVNRQAVPDADGARFRWLCEDHSDRETRERCRRLIDRLPVMSYSDAVMSIDAAMAAAPEHNA